MEKILNQGKIVALKISSLENGSTPVTEPDGSLQVMTLKHPEGKIISPHTHTPQKRETQMLEECLIVLKGHLRVSFFNEDGSMGIQVDVSTGEACLMLSGPHSVEFLEDSEVIEVKNGPFFDDRKDFSLH